MRIMAAEIISTCTLVCPYLIRLTIMEGSVPHLPLTSINPSRPLSSPLPQNISQHSTNNPTLSHSLSDSTSISSQISNTHHENHEQFEQQEQSTQNNQTNNFHLQSEIRSSNNNQSTSSCSSFIVTKPYSTELDYQSQSILFVIIERILCDEETVVIEHLGDTLKVLLDPERFEKSEKEKFLSLFYDYYIHWLLIPFTLNDHPPDKPFEILDTIAPENNFSTLSSASLSSRNYLSSVVFTPQNSSSIYASRRFICEIISLCIFGHTHRIKSYIVRTNLLLKLLKLLSSKTRYYHIYSIKLIKNIITLKDDHYNKYIIKFNIFKPIFELFSSLYTKDNLITSTIIELLEYIRQERIQILIYYIVEKLKSYYIQCLPEEQQRQHFIERNEQPDTSKENHEPCHNYYTELFERFETTYHQLKEYEAEIERTQRYRENENSENSGSRMKRGFSGVVS